MREDLGPTYLEREGGEGWEGKWRLCLYGFHQVKCTLQITSTVELIIDCLCDGKSLDVVILGLQSLYTSTTVHAHIVLVSDCGY